MAAARTCRRCASSSVLPLKAKPEPSAHYLGAVLIARIYEIFPLLCPLCGGQMRIIPFITHSVDTLTARLWIQERLPYPQALAKLI